MAEGNITLQELQKKIGTEAEPHRLELEKGLIRKFAQAVGDSNPLWQDEEYAESSKYGSILAPPYLLCALMAVASTGPEPGTAPLAVPEVPPPLSRILDAGAEWEFFLPMKLGDTITAHSKLADVYEREGKIGKMLFFVYETTYTNQRSEMVARSSSTLINH